MNAEIIAVGSEMLTPERVDTNSLWLTRRLNSLGVELTGKSIVGDDRALLAAAISSALSRVPLLILSGGLGPTEDDITREAVAAALHRRLLFSEEICAGIAARFKRMNRAMADVNRRQAFLIDGAEALPNPNGTAPGQWLELPDGIVVLLPGPPRELKPMFDEQCLPRLTERLPRTEIVTRFYRAAGIGESDLDARIAPLYKPYSNPITTILAAEGDVQIHLRAQGPQAAGLADALGAKILAELGALIYSNTGEPLEAVVGHQLVARQATVAVAESCTAGMLGARLTETPGSSTWFAGGFLVYSDAIKARLLGLDEAWVNENGAVSEAVACAMADAARRLTGATYALSTTGEAGPESSSPDVQPGTVWIGLAGPRGVAAKRFIFPNGRERVRLYATQTALNLLRHEIFR
jgi:nicotinamide-nucleotide amidase